MTAILRGLQRYSEMDLDAELLHIYSDSELSVNLINGTKETKKPHLLKILEPILELKSKLQIKMMWVKAHDTSKWNNYVDTLANSAVSNVTNAHVPVVSAQQPAPAQTSSLLSSNRTRILLSCSFKEKDKVKSLGARWDPENKSWWVEDKPENQETFAKWIVTN
jgi:hypothetical protein